VPQSPRLRRGNGPREPHRADILLLNTSFAGPALAEVVAREGPDVVVYDEEFATVVTTALTGAPTATRILGWTDGAVAGPTVEGLIDERLGQRPKPASTKSRLIRLTSHTTGTPKGARRAEGGGGAGDLKAILDRTPWRVGETTVISPRCSTPGAIRKCSSAR
jgi:hypothetical protein